MRQPGRLLSLILSLPKAGRSLSASLVILLTVFFCGGSAKADSLTITGVEGGFYNLNTGESQYVNLGSNANHVFNFTGPLIGYGEEQVSYVTFRIYIAGITGPRTETLRVTFDQSGGNSPTPAAIDILNIGAFGPTDGYGVMAGFTGGHYEGAPFTLSFTGRINVTILDSIGRVVDSFSSPFAVNRVVPVPEPATLFLLGTGLAGVAARVRKRRQAKSS